MIIKLIFFVILLLIVGGIMWALVTSMTGSALVFPVATAVIVGLAVFRRRAKAAAAAKAAQVSALIPEVTGE